MGPGELLTVWTARFALLLYVLALGLRFGARRPALARLVWTAGCGVFLTHVACAFGFYHEWSHAAAYAHTAQQTAEFVGLNWGGGLYFNYLFTVVWAADVLYWWLAAQNYLQRSRMIEFLVQGFFAFMFFNGAVIFAEGLGRWIGLAVFGLLLTSLAIRWFRSPGAQ